MKRSRNGSILRGHLQERVAGRNEWRRTLWLNSLITNVQFAEVLNPSTENETVLVANLAVHVYS